MRGRQRGLNSPFQHFRFRFAPSFTHQCINLEEEEKQIRKQMVEGTQFEFGIGKEPNYRKAFERS
jgi:hypothetical protein